MKCRLLIATVLLLAGTSFPAHGNVRTVEKAEKEHRLPCVVSFVADGDTVWVTTDAGERRPVRLFRIDAPEGKQPYGAESAELLRKLVGGKRVTVTYSKLDQYNRILGVLWDGGTDVNLKMVEAGAAWHYAYYDRTPAYAAAERNARAAKRGLWADPNPIDPYKWRKTHPRRSKSAASR